MLHTSQWPSYVFVSCALGTRVNVRREKSLLGRPRKLETGPSVCRKRKQEVVEYKVVG